MPRRRAADNASTTQPTAPAGYIEDTPNGAADTCRYTGDAPPTPSQRLDGHPVHRRGCCVRLPGPGHEAAGDGRGVTVDVQREPCSRRQALRPYHPCTTGRGRSRRWRLLADRPTRARLGPGPGLPLLTDLKLLTNRSDSRAVVAWLEEAEVWPRRQCESLPAAASRGPLRQSRWSGRQPLLGSPLGRQVAPEALPPPAWSVAILRLTRSFTSPAAVLQSPLPGFDSRRHLQLSRL